VWLTRELLTVLGVAGLGLAFYAPLVAWDPSEGLKLRSSESEEFFFEPTGGSPLLIFAVASWLVWRRRAILAGSLGAPAWWPAALLLPSALLLAAWGYYVNAPELLVLSLAFLLPGIGAWLCGQRGFRSLVLPGVFLLFAIPLPAVLVNQFMFSLQLFTAELTDTLLKVIGISTVLQADQILTQDKIFQVIETCSGLRLMETLTMSAVVYAQLLDRRPLHAWLLVLLAPCLGSLVNGFRVVTIVLNPYAEFSTVHTTQGIAMLLVGVVVLAGVDWLLEALLDRPSRIRAPEELPPPRSSNGFPARRLAGLAVLLVTLASVRLWWTPWEAPAFGHRTLSDIPIRLGAWKSNSLGIDTTFFGSVGFREQTWRSFESGDDQVHVFVGLDDRLDRRRSLLSEKTRLPGTGWWIEHRASAAGIDALDGELMLLRSRAGDKLALHWYEGLETPGEETFRAFFSLDRGPFRREGFARVVRISTPVERSPQGLVQAEGRLMAFYPVVRDILAALEKGQVPSIAAGPGQGAKGAPQGG
jgi:exosortase